MYDARTVAKRSIPACAGEPPSSSSIAGIPGVYPRVCGGTLAFRLPSGASTGLSPRVRGNPFCRGKGRSSRRSIPACAGEPERALRSLHNARVYPRVCGGTCIALYSLMDGWGLSPRVRGNRIRAIDLVNRQRSIPACAGEPAGAGAPPRPCPVYPRVCGGTAPPKDCLLWEFGLSPRVRGNRDPSPLVLASARSIPACAGEPIDLRRGRRHSRVYPRVCGGTPTARRATPVAIGLSPRVRGNRRSGGIQRAAAGSIPACAGEPKPHLAATAAF